MAIIYRPYGDTDLTNAVYDDAGAVPKAFTGVTAGQWEAAIIDWSPPALVVDPLPVSPAVHRSAESDALLEGPQLGAGVEAVTAVMDISLEDLRLGSYRVLFGITSVHVAGSITFPDASGRGLIRIATQDTAKANYFLAESTLPATKVGRQQIIMTASQNSDGSNTPKVKAFVDGVEVLSRTGTPGDGLMAGWRSPRFPSDTGFPIDLYSFKMFKGTHAEGFTETGDTTGLVEAHSVSGDAAAWNAPGTGLTKLGTTPFTDV